MATITADEQQHREASLKMAIGHQSNLRKWKEVSLKRMSHLALKAIYHTTDGTETRKQLLWQYVKEEGTMWKGESERVGCWTVIKDYTNKKNQTFKAHYSVNGNFIKKANTDDVPESYEGWFKVKPSTFSLKVVKIESTEDNDECYKLWTTPILKPSAIKTLHQMAINSHRLGENDDDTDKE